MKSDLSSSDALTGTEVQSARVQQLADVLINCYGSQALERAELIERQSSAPELAKAVTAAVKQRLSNPHQ